MIVCPVIHPAWSVADVADDDGGSLAGEAYRDRLSDAAGGSGD